MAARMSGTHAATRQCPLEQHRNGVLQCTEAVDFATDTAR